MDGSERPSNLESQEIKLREVKDLEEPLEDILEQIKPEIESGTYRLIIGEDASGRIPALVIGGVINRQHENKGFPKALTVFLPVGA